MSKCPHCESYAIEKVTIKIKQMENTRRDSPTYKKLIKRKPKPTGLFMSIICLPFAYWFYIRFAEGKGYWPLVISVVLALFFFWTWRMSVKDQPANMHNFNNEWFCSTCERFSMPKGFKKK